MTQNPGPISGGEIERLVRGRPHDNDASPEADYARQCLDAIRRLTAQLSEQKRIFLECSNKWDAALTRATTAETALSVARGALTEVGADLRSVAMGMSSRDRGFGFISRALRTIDAALSTPAQRESDDAKRSRIIRERAAQIARDYEP